MKLITYRYQNKEQIGAVIDQEVVPLAALGVSEKTMLDFIGNSSPEQLAQLSEVAQRCEERLPLAGVRLEAPIPEPRQDILCLGINYMDHAEESARFKLEKFDGKREYAVYFAKRVSRASGSGDPIPAYPELTQSLDYEAELAVIIGKPCRNLTPESVQEHIFGYTILNDVSARDLQTRHKQWYFGKSLDGFCPMGPWIVTADEITYPPELPIRSIVNGELRQNSNTRLLIFDIEHVLCELSAGMTIQAGTILSMGTPAGVGMGFTPPKFLKAGDSVVCEIDGIGRLTNFVKS